MTAAQENLDNPTAALLHEHFDLQRRAYLAAPNPDYKQRKDDLLALKRMITENMDAIIEAISAVPSLKLRQNVALVFLSHRYF